MKRCNLSDDYEKPQLQVRQVVVVEESKQPSSSAVKRVLRWRLERN